jgi:hypothetical protein
MNEAREKQTFDVFLSPSSKDKPAVRALGNLESERLGPMSEIQSEERRVKVLVG